MPENAAKYPTPSDSNVTFKPKVPRRKRISAKQAMDIERIKMAALVVLEENKALLADRELLNRLDALWLQGSEDMGTDEMGTVFFRRVAALVAIREGDGTYPDVRTLLRDMDSPPRPASELIQ